MSVIADSGAIYALYDSKDKYHTSVRQVIQQESGTIIIPTVILVEIDYLIREFVGIHAELDFIADIMDGSYQLEPLLADDFRRCYDLINQYQGLDLGLADTAVMVIAERLDIYRVLTVDERDFRAVKPKKKPFVLLPADIWP